MEKLLQNKKLLIFIVVAFLAVLVICVGFILGRGSKPSSNNEGDLSGNTSVDTENPNSTEGESPVRKNMLIIDNDDYSLKMDLLGTWKEYLLPIDERDKYQAFMIPDTTTEAIPYFYILIEKDDISTGRISEEDILYELKSDNPSFELEQILNGSTNDITKYNVLYKTKQGRNETKNYLTVMYIDGYKIYFTYSALDLAYSSERGYIDDMIDTVVFEPKT